MLQAITQIDDVLRGRPAIAPRDGIEIARDRTPQLAALLVAFGLLYGAAMGCFNWPQSVRPLQVLFSALKVPLLLLGTFAISLPSFFVFNALLGLRRDLREAMRALIATQAGLTITLASLAPFTALWYASFRDYQQAILFNAAMFAVASVAGQRLLRRYYAPLIRRNPRHRVMVRLWLFIYAFVGIQMGWLLRPFVGKPGIATTFFRQDSWGNAYEQVGKIIWYVIGG